MDPNWSKSIADVPNWCERFNIDPSRLGKRLRAFETFLEAFWKWLKIFGNNLELHESFWNLFGGLWVYFRELLEVFGKHWEFLEFFLRSLGILRKFLNILESLSSFQSFWVFVKVFKFVFLSFGSFLGFFRKSWEALNIFWKILVYFWKCLKIFRNLCGFPLKIFKYFRLLKILLVLRLPKGFVLKKTRTAIPIAIYLRSTLQIKHQCTLCKHTFYQNEILYSLQHNN